MAKSDVGKLDEALNVPRGANSTLRCKTCRLHKDVLPLIDRYLERVAEGSTDWSLEMFRELLHEHHDYLLGLTALRTHMRAHHADAYRKAFRGSG